MDCPKCGAYNASSSFRCRRCGEILPAEPGEETSSDDWGPASNPNDTWDDSQEEQQVDEQQAAETNPWAWSEPEQPQEQEWSSSQSTQPSYSEAQAQWDQGPTYESTSYGYSPDVPNYLWPAIGATICCCAPLGIPAIVYASRVDAYLKANDRTAAEEASSKAKTWVIAAVAVSLMVWIALFCTGAFSGGAPA